MTEPPPNGPKFQTPNSALAAWLWSQEYEPVEFVTTEPRGLVVFPDSEALQKCRRLWESGQAIGDCNAFYARYRTILERLKSSRQWR